MSPRAAIPQAALDWLVPGEQREVVTLGAPVAAITAGLAAHHHLTLTDRDPAALTALLRSAPRARRVVGQAESMPYGPYQFDIAVAAQTLHTLAPGLALAEIARVLKPGGLLSIVYLTRDDTVPWVRRLATILQQADPTAMRGGYGAESVAHLTDSSYFPELENRTFRMWVPVTRKALIAMVRARTTLRTSSPETLDELADAVGALYDASARAPEPLMLPWKVQCWRGEVDHSELSRPLIMPDAAVNIRL
jgi:ubiquinone/menaquinone biosynthesis C-methylase UbiE